MKTLLILALIAAPDSSMLAISGAASMEELDETQVEMYQNLAARPLDINSASRSRLISSGLFSPFQAASIIDYRQHSGDILSLAELCALDGFNAELAGALEPYVCFISDSGPGALSSGNELYGSATARIWTKTEEQASELSYGIKFKLEAGQRGGVAIAAKRPYGQESFLPEALNWSAVYYGRRHLGKVIVGDFNARFGQGLVLWSGFALSSLSSIQSFYRKPSGLSPSFSYTSSGMRGIAADFSFGKFSLSGAVSMPRDGKAAAPMLSGNWFAHNGQIGLNAVLNAKGEILAGADTRWNFGKADVFAEAAYNVSSGHPSMVAGTVWNIDYDMKIALRALASEKERGLAAGAQIRKAFLSAELSDKPSSRLKYRLDIPVTITDNLSLQTRVSGKLSDDSVRTQIRAALLWESGPWRACLRGDTVKGDGLACLLYAEPGLVTGNFSTYLRATLFAVDDWDDRIYVYERDAPGNFNMKAYYGRGASISAVAGWKIKKQRVHLRASLMESDRISRLEMHFQYSLEF